MTTINLQPQLVLQGCRFFQQLHSDYNIFLLYINYNLINNFTLAKNKISVQYSKEQSTSCSTSILQNKEDYPQILSEVFHQMMLQQFLQNKCKNTYLNQYEILIDEQNIGIGTQLAVEILTGLCIGYEFGGNSETPCIQNVENGNINKIPLGIM
ncbi:Conserved_hypothetical protein [Hexamita inflata]|uniref:Uncharacterized protein n=2 Tax=Hexamita inflata TaxID=28002 RepID=A0AA86NFW8_9EUKA|nr:Conserved hypothetical protein [Hexamita inflata]